MSKQEKFKNKVLSWFKGIGAEEVKNPALTNCYKVKHPTVGLIRFRVNSEKYSETCTVYCKCIEKDIWNKQTQFKPDNDYSGKHNFHQAVKGNSLEDIWNCFLFKYSKLFPLPTDVMYRVDKCSGEINVVLPYTPHSYMDNCIVCITKNGGHGSCDWNWVLKNTTPLKDEVKILETRNWVRAIGYVPMEITRRNRNRLTDIQKS